MTHIRTPLTRVYWRAVWGYVRLERMGVSDVTSDTDSMVKLAIYTRAMRELAKLQDEEKTWIQRALIQRRLTNGRETHD